jgi:hypothetical protein
LKALQEAKDADPDGEQGKRLTEIIAKIKAEGK